VTQQSDTEPDIRDRKGDHIRIYLTRHTHAHVNPWDDITFVHKALPEVDMDKISLSCELFGKKLSAPLVISAITGGYPEGAFINSNLAEAAGIVGIGMGVGSQRPAFVDPATQMTYSIIKDYDVPLVIGNLGVPQFVAQKDKEVYSVDDAKAAMEMVGADILAIHLNFLQEAVQVEGDTNGEGCLARIEELAKAHPILAKETGAGMSRETALALKEAGVKGIDVGGQGGTSFAAVESHRAHERGNPQKASIGRTFWDWGIPTPVSILEADVGLPIIGTGGIRNGLDVARALAMGANAGGFAGHILKAATENPDAVVKVLEQIIGELKVAMFLIGAKDVDGVKKADLMISGDVKTWIDARGLGRSE